MYGIDTLVISVDTISTRNITFFLPPSSKLLIPNPCKAKEISRAEVVGTITKDLRTSNHIIPSLKMYYCEEVVILLFEINLVLFLVQGMNSTYRSVSMV